MTTYRRGPGRPAKGTRPPRDEKLIAAVQDMMRRRKQADADYERYFGAMVDEGWTHAEIAELLELSRGRIGQMVSERYDRQQGKAAG